ncbi:hypothetical protein [Shewanella scandinavica]|uniref:hypothetical protein n=1 Tax=Shewanella scandinavica TaxID=3063538 RepID=UPI0031987F74
MSELIELGVRQGVVIGFSSQLSNKDPAFKSLENIIRSGRFGLFEQKGVIPQYLYVVLTQDCSISCGTYVELAQLKKIDVRDETRVEHLFIGKDYSKLYLKYDTETYVIEEVLLTKIKHSDFLNALKSSQLIVKGILETNTIRILLDWRVLAYFREPYPDRFNRILGEYLKGEGVWFTEFLKEHQDVIHSVRIFVTPDDIENASDYKFSITALLNDGCQKYEDDISQAIDSMLEILNSYDGIDCIQSESFDVGSIDFPTHLILSTTAYLDEFSFANAYVMREFNFQFLCY